MAKRITKQTKQRRMEKALRESEARYETLFVDAPEGILVADLQTKQFTHANPAICRMFGYTEEELMRLGVPDIHPKESLDYVLAEFEAQARGEKVLATLPCRRKDGTSFYANVSAVKMFLDGRKCNVGFFTDVTELKETQDALKHALKEWQDTFNSMPDFICVLDKDNTITKANFRFSEAFNLSHEEMVGKKCYEVFHKSDRPCPGCPFELTKKDGLPHSAEINDPNIKIPLLITIVPIFDEKKELIGAVHVARDISKIKSLERERKRD